MAKRVYDPVPGPVAAPPITVMADPAVRQRAGLATHTRVLGGMRWADALAATSADFDKKWFPRGL